MTGPITEQALIAARNLKVKFNICSDVIAIPTIKPLKAKALIESAKKTKKVVTIEEHQIYNGLGSAVAEVLSQNLPTKMLIIGVEDTFCESGSYSDLINKYGLASHRIEEKIIKFLKGF